jgi:hypothetical protein
MGAGLGYSVMMLALLLPKSDAKALSGKYRLGDVVNGFQAKFGVGWETVRDHYQSVHPGSIAAEYLTVAVTNPKNERVDDFVLLSHIVKQRFDEWPPANAGEDGIGLVGSLPGDDTLVAHLRLGDVTEGLGMKVGYELTAQEIFHDGVWIGAVKTQYVQPRSYYEQVIADLPSSVRNVVLIGSFKHGAKNGSDHHASIGYRELLTQLFECKGFEVVHRFERNPDADMTFAAHAKYFAVGGGGYSTLMGECAHRLGGIVFTCGHFGKKCNYKVRAPFHLPKNRKRRTNSTSNLISISTRLPSCP